VPQDRRWSISTINGLTVFFEGWSAPFRKVTPSASSRKRARQPRLLLSISRHKESNILEGSDHDHASIRLVEHDKLPKTLLIWRCSTNSR